MCVNGVNGMKKFYNHLKRKEARASMEDVEFLECQEEMNKQVFEQYTLVGRVIGRMMVALEYQHVLLSLSLRSIRAGVPVQVEGTPLL